VTASQTATPLDIDDDVAPRTPWVLSVFLIVAGALGWWASFALTLDKFKLLEDPKAVLECNISVLVSCGKNLGSWQGEVFGFPNPLLGLGGFVAPIAVGVGLLAGARFARWYWWLFNLGLAGALAFVIWLISQSFWFLGVLCPWCALVWVVTIPLFLVVTIRNLAEGRFGTDERATRVGSALTTWIVPITIICYLVIAVIAQVRLDILSDLF
jgi:uncharacterized membrane protein